MSLTIRPQLPLFNGEPQGKEGQRETAFCSPKDFLQRAEDEKMANNWSDEETMRQVISSLRGMASRWFHCGIRPTLHPLDYENLKTNFQKFKQFFTDWFLVAENISGIDWSGLIQEEDETPSAFGFRVLRTHQKLMDQMSKIITPRPAPLVTEEIQGHLQLIPDIAQREVFQKEATFSFFLHNMRRSAH